MSRHPRTWLAAALVVAALAVGGTTGCTSAGDAGHGSMDPSAGPTMDPAMGSMAHAGAPAGAEEGVDAGFAYDMSVHHAQAVEMAELVAGRVTDPEVAVLARDLALTQQYQIGEMRGWLDGWGLPPTTTRAAMTWMSMSGPMPGLATRDELERLRTAAPGEVDRQFLELMVRHHRGGLAMTEYARDHASAPFVRQFAASIADSQVAEIDTMTEILQRLPA